ncbi:restriction endonuclease subunit S [Clostridium sp. MT-14]|uniref:restriction endonuclease subunit S n=1 Tax=Clostridium sp. MT-14 TaxID=3348360 RepID=UPI0035F26EC1
MDKNKANVPKIRFPGFTDPWEQRKAGDIFFTVVDKNHPELPVLSASQEFGMIKRDNSGINISYNKENEIGYKRVMPGQFVIHLRSFQGGFAHSNIEGITSPAYTVMDFVEKSNHYDHFWKYIFNSESFIKRLELITYGIRDGRSISYKDFATLPFKFPQYEEQKKIGAFFIELDDLITLHQRKLNHLKDEKKGLLQKMFPKNGEKFPELRFPGFTDSWEQRKLSDMKNVRDGTHDSPKYHNEGHPLVTSKNLTDHGLDMSDVSLISDEDFEAINQRSKVDVGDIIFGMIGTIGNPVILERDDFAIKNVALLKNGGEVDNRFLIQLLKSPVFDRYMRKENAGGTQKFLGLSQIRNFEFLTPAMDEQVKIGEFFKNLDHLITLHQRKLNHLQEQKKALLQQMFI